MLDDRSTQGHGNAVPLLFEDKTATKSHPDC